MLEIKTYDCGLTYEIIYRGVYLCIVSASDLQYALLEHKNNLFPEFPSSGARLIIENEDK